MSIDSALHAHWRAVARHFPAWSFPVDVFLNPGTWRFVGVDLMGAMRADPRVKRAFAALGQTPAHMLLSLSTMAQLNARRADDAFKSVAVAYISVPIALAALVSEAAPDVTRAAVLANLENIVIGVLTLLLTPVVYFCGAWRAKQIAWTIDLYRANAAAHGEAPEALEREI